MVYTIFRSNRKTLSLRVDAAGNVIVRAPHRVKDDEIARFVQKHAAWIERKQAQRRPVPTFAVGDAVTLFGKEYIIVPGKKAVRWGDALLQVTDAREADLKQLLRDLARTYMMQLTDSIAYSYHFSYNKLRISSSRGRWGSCSSLGTISYSFRVAFLPPRLVHYCRTRTVSSSAYGSFGCILERSRGNFAGLQGTSARITYI